MLVTMFEIGLLGGVLAVASNPSPYYAAFGLVAMAGIGCLILMDGGVSFLSLILFLVYLGGMMVVFAYTAALVVEPHPEAWGNYGVIGYMMGYAVLLAFWWWIGGNTEGVSQKVGAEMFNLDWVGVSVMYSWGGVVLSLVGWAMLLTLFVVLEVVRGHYSGALQAV
uniref:NADH-ubiquinone oxidoreductase chain 6 n=1 Tax=Bokermannohyla alvarengai TaxID=1513809 RepID=A0A343RF69_BOKAL|nr:NADH dehydrogenase subunit 6 [Bokermannohyla alvarengai]ATY40986.1 NADH dehydrogenase subunit 6 [Bokermannohyla alvarengai]